MFTVEEREAIRSRILELARRDERITGGALTGSAAAGKEDQWSDIDLAFGVRKDIALDEVIKDFSDEMYSSHDAVDHLDVPSGPWIYRVFLLRNTLQVDLAFVSEEFFGARAPTFNLEFGIATELEHMKPSAKKLLGWAWLYALHARSCMARNKPLQAEYMISGMRDHVLALTCLRLGLPTSEGRGFDDLPEDIQQRFEMMLVTGTAPGLLLRAFGEVSSQFRKEARYLDPDLTGPFPAIYDLTLEFMDSRRTYRFCTLLTAKEMQESRKTDTD